MPNGLKNCPFCTDVPQSLKDKIKAFGNGPIMVDSGETKFIDPEKRRANELARRIEKSKSDYRMSEAERKLIIEALRRLT